MKERFIDKNGKEFNSYQIVGGNELSGIVSPGGSKNATFPILAASILLDEPIKLNNVPKIEDVGCFIEILDSLGATITYEEGNSLEIDPRSISETNVPSHLGSKIRGSYYLLGALLSRFGKASIPPPGGCSVGERPMDQHFIALEKMGYEFQVGETSALGQKRADWDEKQIIIKLPFPSRGATINTLLASSLSVGCRTKLINYNQSPETQSLIYFLQKAGVKIEILDDRLHILGTSRASLTDFTIIPDKIEAVTLLTAGLITKGDITVKNVIINHLRPFLDKLEQIGFKCVMGEHSVRVNSVDSDNLQPTDVISGLGPTDIDADFEPILASLLCTINGDSIIEDQMNPGRHSQFIPQLNKLGAHIDQISETRALIHGGTVFHSGEARCNEIRGGAALLLATLSAKGESVISNVSQIERGYEKLDQKLVKLGANITKFGK